MTEPVSKKLQVSGYTGLQAGVIKSPTDKAYANAGAILGGEANYKGTFLRGQVEAGTALGGKLELGHTFDIGENMGLELSAKTEINKSLTSNNTFNAGTKNINSLTLVNTGDCSQVVNVNVPLNSEYSASWKGGETRTGMAAKLTFGSKKAKFSIGAEAGFRKGNRPDMAYSFEGNSTIDILVNGQVQSQKTVASAFCTSKTNNQLYATALVSADLQTGKQTHLKLNADLQRGEITFVKNLFKK